MTKAPKPSARLKVKVVPGSSRDGIVGWLGDALKIKVTAPPEKGRANELVVKMLAERLGLPADAVAVVSGHSSASKVITINGMMTRCSRSLSGSRDQKQNHPAVLFGTRPGGLWVGLLDQRAWRFSARHASSAFS